MNGIAGIVMDIRMLRIINSFHSPPRRCLVAALLLLRLVWKTARIGPVIYICSRNLPCIRLHLYPNELPIYTTSVS